MKNEESKTTLRERIDVLIELVAKEKINCDRRITALDRQIGIVDGILVGMYGYNAKP